MPRAASFAWVGILTGFAAEQSVVLAWVWAVLLVVATFVVGMVFPKLRPRYLEEQIVAAGEEQRRGQD